jgi:protocatechuate 3,4-dioxygenase beta subunit
MNSRHLLLIPTAVTILASCTQLTQTPFPSQNVEQERGSTVTDSTFSTEIITPESVTTETDDQATSDPTDTITLSNPTPTQIPCSGELTSSNQEGPFYKSGSPERESLINDRLPGTPILIMGRVFDQDCNPIPGVTLDFWLADINGEYDNVGYTLRGHQFSDENGFYAIESIEPTPYTGRPAHIHVKLFAPDGRELLTTQLYFPGSESSADVQDSPNLLVTYLEPDLNGRRQILFNFVVQN